MTPEDIAFTTRWWEALLDDEPRMVRWLQKLWLTEYNGYADNMEASKKWSGGNPAVENIFHRTAEDEEEHANLLRGLLTRRGAFPPEPWPEDSDYWAEMEVHIVSLETCAAVFHLGEKLAAERFEVLAAHPRTPWDIKTFLDIALPDEQHHARIFLKLTTPLALADIATAHEQIVTKLKTPAAKAEKD